MIGRDSELRAVMVAAQGLRRRVLWLIAAAGAALLLAWWSGEAGMRLSMLMTGLTLLVLSVIIVVLAAAGRLRERQQARQLAQLVGADAAPCFTTDDFGRILYRNAAALGRFGDTPTETLVAVLHEQFASPSAVLFRLQSRAGAQGAAREDMVTRHGHLRLSVHRLSPLRFLWRIEEFQDRGNGRGAEALSLPMVVANRAGVVLFSNEAMRRLIGERPKRLDRIFTQAHFASGDEVGVAGSAGVLRAIVAEVEGAGDRREIFLLPAAHSRDENTSPTDFDNVPVALLKFGADGAMRSANRAARDLLGDQARSGMYFHDLFEDLGRPVMDWLDDVVAQRLPEAVEVLRLRLGDEESFVQVQLRRIVERGRQGVLAILSDATALKRLEAQFNQSQKMQAIGQLAGGIAHDFNNLLTAISGYCDLLLLRHGREDADFADLEQIRQNANRAAALVNQLLAFSRKQTLKPERLDLQELLSDVTHLLNRLVGERITLRFAHDPLLGPVRADRRRLEQVLMNLVVNARDAMAADGGTIRIETEAVSISEPLHRGRATIPAGEYSVIRVKDTGCGIAEDKIDKIFEPFFTTKRPGEGTGLGLSTVYGIVKQSGGYVFVESRPGQGTVFDLLFPVHDHVEIDLAPVFGPSDPLPLPPRKSGGVVLLVEDEAPVRAFASRALRLRGFTVLEAESAEEALETLEDPSVEVDVFVTDVIMPGLDGPTWVRQALEQRPGVRVIFVSGYAEDCVSAEQGMIPNSTFLPKPFSLNELTATVQGQLH